MRIYESNFDQATEARQQGSPVLPPTNCLLWPHLWWKRSRQHCTIDQKILGTVSEKNYCHQLCAWKVLHWNKKDMFLVNKGWKSYETLRFPDLWKNMYSIAASDGFVLKRFKAGFLVISLLEKVKILTFTARLIATATQIQAGETPGFQSWVSKESHQVTPISSVCSWA